ncbi:MAG: acyl carrier protein [Clostridia bacterium]|nr:acyl carrier protein [Clostridia bacterium]
MFEKVKEVLIKQLRLKDREVLPSSKIKEDLGADSLDLLELLMTLETDYGVVIPDEELITFETVQDIVDYMEKASNK